MYTRLTLLALCQSIFSGAWASNNSVTHQLANRVTLANYQCYTQGNQQCYTQANLQCYTGSVFCMVCGYDGVAHKKVQWCLTPTHTPSPTKPAFSDWWRLRGVTSILVIYSAAVICSGRGRAAKTPPLAPFALRGPPPRAPPPQ